MKPTFDPAYLCYFFQTVCYWRQIERGKRGIGQPNVNASTLAMISLPLAPPKEQGRIVAKLEELFSDLDAGVAALKRAKANLKRYRAAVLKAAVEGKLTEQWRAAHPDTEPATDLLARILTERRRRWEEEQHAKYKSAGKQPPKGWKDRYQEPAKPDVSVLQELPKGWFWAHVEQVGEVQLGRQRSPKNRSKDHPTKYVRAANLTEHGLDLSDVLDMEFSPSELETYRLVPGDVLLSEASGSPDQVGKPVIWKGELADCCFQNTVIRLQPTLMDSEFLLVVFRHFYVNKLFAKISAGVGINHLSAGKFSRIVIGVPPLEEQRQIGCEVAEKLSQIEAAETAIEHGLRRATRLRQSILKQAFEGKLVPQIEASTEAPGSFLFKDFALLANPPARPATKATGNIKHRKGIAFYRGAVLCYAIDSLHSSPTFGRVQAMKVLYLCEAWLGLDLELEPKREVAGPLDQAIYKVEGLARKQGWFTTKKQGPIYRYIPGDAITDRVGAARSILGTKLADMDRLLDWIRHMDTEQAELFATTFAVWNDLLIDAKDATDDAIVKGLHSWHESKAKFSTDRIIACIEWMKEKRCVPRGLGPSSTAISLE